MTAPDGYAADVTGCIAGSEGVRGEGLSTPAGIACPAEFAEAVRVLAARRGTSPAALAAAVLLLTGAHPLEEDPGPGEAVLDAWPPGCADESVVRRALAVALALADGVVPLRDAERLETRLVALEHRNKTLNTAIERLAFQPLPGGLTGLRDALAVFGFVNEWCFDEDLVRRRFRELAPVYHPDTGVVGCRQRMAQLLEARTLLIRHVRTAYAAGRWRAAGSARS
jgi:hypothetical protein